LVNGSGTTNVNERQRTGSRLFYSFACDLRPHELFGNPPVLAIDYWHPLTFAVIRLK